MHPSRRPASACSTWRAAGRLAKIFTWPCLENALICRMADSAAPQQSPGGMSRWLSGQGGELALEQAALALVPAEPYGELDFMPCVVELPEAAEQLAAHAR